MLTVTNRPFPHAIVDDHWPDKLLRDVAAEFPAPGASGWITYCTANGDISKYEGPPEMWGPSTYELFGKLERFAPQLSQAFDIPDLHMETFGGGYHLIPPGGKLGMHVDFNRSASTETYRRLNLLIYLNDDWNDNRGALELGLGRLVVIRPEFGRMVVFATSDRSWHGHPEPSNRWRASIAAYYFSTEPPPDYTHRHETVWLA